MHPQLIREYTRTSVVTGGTPDALGRSVGDTLLAGRYRLGPLVGAGAMGAVYCAHDIVRDVDVAVKMLRVDQAGGGIARRYLQAEGRLARRVSHRNVVAILDAGATSDCDPFVVMELVAGRPLRDLLHEHGPLGLRRASAIVQQLLAGLHAIHAAGLVHGDVKADNVLVCADDHVTLIDLGLVRSRAHTGRRNDSVASGTPEYMAPEVIRGERAMVESDLYAAGILLYELVTGTTPFAGGSSAEILCRQLDDEIVPAGLRCPDRGIPRGLEDVMRRALEKDPAARFRSARAFSCTLAAATPRSEPAFSLAPVAFSTEGATASWRVEPEPRPRFATGTRPPKTGRR